MSWSKRRPKSQNPRVPVVRSMDEAPAKPETDATQGPRADAAPRRERRLEERRASDRSARAAATIGARITMQGEVSGGEDLFVDGRIEGRVDLPEHTLTVRRSGCVEADVRARQVLIQGTVVGNVEAERIEITDSGKLTGDIKTGDLVIAEGAKFRGAIEMEMDRDEEPAAPDQHAPEPAGPTRSEQASARNPELPGSSPRFSPQSAVDEVDLEDLVDVPADEDPVAEASTTTEPVAKGESLDGLFDR